MKKLVITIIVLTTISLLYGCGYSENQVEAMCSEQYAFGFAFGHQDGYDEGYKVGNSEGFENGYEQGLSEGYLSGKADGYASGYQTGNEDQAKNTEPESIVYIGNKNSNVLHLPSCGSLPKTENRVYFESIEEAFAEGFRACSGCMPETSETDSD